MILKVTSYFHAGHLFQIARRTATSSFKKDFSIVSIMFSVSALEAFINESVELARLVPTNERQAIVDAYASVMSELEERKEALAVKYHIGLLVLSGSTWKEGTQPFQDFKLLLTIRNQIVHIKADRFEARLTPRGPERKKLEQFPKFITALQQKHLLDAARSESWFDLINNKRVARWACETATGITAAFLDAVPDGYYKQALRKHMFRLKRRQ